MTNRRWKYRWAPLAAAGLLGLALMTGTSTSVRADDDEGVAPDVRFLRGILHGLGLRRDGEGIDYRERSPLVVPPGRNLPTPETNSPEKAAAWPNDPDVKRAKEMKAQRKQRTKTVEDEYRPELPDQLGPKAKTTPPGQVPTAGPYKDPTAPSTWTELGSKSFFNMGGLMGINKEEYATFTSEPPRTSLTEPPAGYRTPSPAHPYGVGKLRGETGKADVMEHATGQR